MKHLRLQELFLTREELPILSSNSFYIPIHPRLFDPNLRFDGRIAKQVFPKTAEEWYVELGEYAKALEDGKEKRWIEKQFLSEKPEILTRAGVQRLSALDWEDDVSLGDNGFATGLGINRNHGGTLYIDPLGCLEEPVGLSGNRHIHFSPGKVKEFAAKVSDQKAGRFKIKVYSQHNIDHYPGALFLRDWAINYMNALFQRYHKELLGKHSI